MDVIKLMVDSDYKMGYDDLSNTPYADLADVFNKLGERVQKAHPAGDVIYTSNNGHDWRRGYFVTENRKKEHLVHPLWNVTTEETEDGYYAQDMFRLQRNVKPQPAQSSIQDNPPKSSEEKHRAPRGEADCGELG